MKIDIRDNISPCVALELVSRVVARGKVSEGNDGKMYYCWVTKFNIGYDDTIVVYTRENRKDDCFVVYKE